jgi:hypothetical protein
VFKHLDEVAGSRKDMVSGVLLFYGGETLEIGVAIPRKVFEKGTDAIWQYLYDTCPDEFKRLRREYERIQADRAREAADVLKKEE